jgi:2-polyprenyl-3-methyl-5-hydroxy-6-metoxy-1,4-benzoquinol methylase
MRSNAVRIEYPSLRRIAYLVYRTKPALFVRTLELEKLLFGGDLHSGSTYARLSGDFVTPSTPVAQSPHALFLREYRDIGETIFQPGRFTSTPYCKYAIKCIELYGRFFSHSDLAGVLLRAKSFARMFDGTSSSSDQDSFGSRPGEPVAVRKIRLSNCYEIYDGLHRLSIAAVRGVKKYPCAVLPLEGTLTGMQLLVMDSVWWGDRCRLYQPIPFSELQTWPVARQCTDRLELILAWLQRNGILQGSVLDVGSNYGWFVSEMLKRGYKAVGVEQDAALATVGPSAYGFDSANITVENIEHFLESAGQKYDIVFCLSLLPAFLLGHAKMSGAELIRSIDKMSGSVMFFETAACHETRYKHSLAGWDAQFIQRWLKENTSFSKIELLGTDRDRSGPFPVRYGRHLFACSRDE